MDPSSFLGKNGTMTHRLLMQQVQTLFYEEKFGALSPAGSITTDCSQPYGRSYTLGQGMVANDGQPPRRATKSA